MISNQKHSYKTLTAFSDIWAGLVIVLALSFFDLFEFPRWMQVALAGIIAGIALFFRMGGYYFIQVEVKEDKELMVKYYNLFPAGRKFRAFKIPLQQLHHHEIEYKTGSLTSWLILYQKMQGGIAKFPPVGLSAATKKERRKIDEFLKKLENTSFSTIDR
jgi:hypothetical protein